MSNSTINNLTDGSTADDTDVIPVERSPYGPGRNRKVSVSQVRKNITGIKIAVIGDSDSALWPHFDEAWPNQIERHLNSAGAKVEVRVFATGSHTFFRCNTTTTYGSSTTVEAAIAYKPDVVMVMLGGNDVIGGDSRTITQIQTDASTLFAALAAGLPSAVLIMVAATLYDTANFTTSNVVNKGTLPNLHTPKSSGILSGLETSEYLDDAVSSTNRTALADYDTLITHIGTISGVNVLTINLFRVARLGTYMVDRIHPTAFGQALINGYIIKGLRNITAFTALVPVIATQPTGNLFEGEDPDEFFEDCLVASGDGYVDNTPGVLGSEGVISQWGWRGYHLDNWFMSYKASFGFDTATPYNSPEADGFLFFFVRGAAPNSAVTFSVDGAAFSGTIATTDAQGNCQTKHAIGLLNLSNAAHSFRYKIGTSVFGPYTITTADSPFSSTNITAVGNVGAGEDDLMSFSIPAGFALPVARRKVEVEMHGTMANNAAAKTVRVYFGAGAALFSLSLTANLAGNWHVRMVVTSTGSDTQMWWAQIGWQTAAGTWFKGDTQGTLTEDDDAALTVKATGQATNDNDIIQTYMYVDYKR